MQGQAVQSHARPSHRIKSGVLKAVHLNQVKGCDNECNKWQADDKRLCKGVVRRKDG